ncbi:MAG TPA: hypothetical protein VEQ58_05915 [Polyangiaceae bacterium]|nr:hypothetical protein [Polyangiaceae bacterium]
MSLSQALCSAMARVARIDATRKLCRTSTARKRRTERDRFLMIGEHELPPKHDGKSLVRRLQPLALK